jgi:hypothetical protein
MLLPRRFYSRHLGLLGLDSAATIQFWVFHSTLMTTAFVLNIITASGASGACRQNLVSAKFYQFVQLAGVSRTL